MHADVFTGLDLLTCIFYSGEAAKLAAQEKVEAQQAQQAAMLAVETETKAHEAAPQASAVSEIDFNAYTHRLVSFLARNFYNLKYVALVLAFGINFILLFYKVSIVSIP